MRIILIVMALLACALPALSGTNSKIPVRISGFLCLDPDLRIPSGGRRVTISLEDRKWHPVARTNIVVRPGETRIPWSLSVRHPEHYPGRLNLGYRISEETEAHGQGWWSADGTVYDRRAAGSILLSNGRHTQVRLCILRGTVLRGVVLLKNASAILAAGIRLIDQTGRSRGIRWYKPRAGSSRIVWTRTWPFLTAPERVRVEVRLRTKDGMNIFWGHGSGLTHETTNATGYLLANREQIILSNQ